MREPARGERLVVWSLATFHTVFFVAALVAVVHASGSLGGLPRTLNTPAGLALFGLLWRTTGWSTARMLRGVRLELLEPGPSSGALLGLGAFWGGVNGLAFLLVLLGGLLFVAVPTSPAGVLGLLVGTLWVAVTVGPIAVTIAFLFGAAVGLLLATLDGLALDLSRRVVSAAAAVGTPG